MNDQPTQPDQPNGERKPIRSVLWLLCAFVPAAVMIACLRIKSEWLPPLLLFFAGVCSIASSIGLALNVKNMIARFVLVMFLALFFFGANFFIVILVGCS